MISRFIEQTSDPAGENLRLAGTGTGQNEQRALIPIHGLPLDFCQFPQSIGEWIISHASPLKLAIASRKACGIRCAIAPSTATRVPSAAA